MGLFSALKKTVRATARAALLPIDVASDVITLGGVSTRDGKSAVVKRGARVFEDLADALEELGEE